MWIGHVTSDIMSIFLNLSATVCDNNHPTKSLAVSFIDLNGDIRITEEGYLLLAKWHAGLQPIDLPKMIISEFETPKLRVKWSYTHSASINS